MPKYIYFVRKVGDIIRMENNQFIAADILLLSSSEPNGLCFIETAELDGETNLKCKQCLVETAEMGDAVDQLGQFNGEIVCEPPNNLLNRFDGTLIWNGQRYSLDNEKILLRGCVLRNTQWCYGVVVFAGKDTKLMQNSGKTKFKSTSIDRFLNFTIIGVRKSAMGANVRVCCVIHNSFSRPRLFYSYSQYVPFAPLPVPCGSLSSERIFRQVSCIIYFAVSLSIHFTNTKYWGGASPIFLLLRFQLLLRLDHLQNARVHLLDHIEFRQSHRASIRQIVYPILNVGQVGRFHAASNQIVLGRQLLQPRAVGTQQRQANVRRRMQTGAHIGGRKRQITQTRMAHEAHRVTDHLQGADEPLVHLAQIAARLHGHHANVVLLVHPHQKGFVVIAIQSAALRPEPARFGGQQKAIALLEQETILLQLFGNVRIDVQECMEFAFELALHILEYGSHLLQQFAILLIRHLDHEREAVHRAVGTHADRLHVFAIRIDVGQLHRITPCDLRLGGVFSETQMIVLDDRIEEIRKHCIRINIGRIESDHRIVMLQARLNAVQERGARCSFLLFQRIEEVARQVFLQQRSAGVVLLEIEQSRLQNHGHLAGRSLQIVAHRSELLVELRNALGGILVVGLQIVVHIFGGA